MPEISVVLPTHNRSSWLQLALASVLAQRNVDLEVIVVDDASTDDTAEAVRSLDDARVRLLQHETPRGVAASRNHGAAEAHGDWVAFIDDDDLWAPEKLTRQLQAARATKRSWAYAGAVNIDNQLQVIGGLRPLPPAETVNLLPRRNAIPGGGSNVILRRDLFERAGPFETRLKNTEDWELSIRLAKLAEPAWVPEPLIARRLHHENSSLDCDEIFRGLKLIERLHGTRADRGMLHLWIAQSHIRTGERAEAIRHFALAAIRGQVRSVAGEVSTILRRRARHLLRRGREGSGIHPSDPEWLGRAQPWLDDLAHQVAEER